MWLARLREDRANFKPFVEAVDRDLQQERANRIAMERAKIENDVVQAYVAGAKIADIKRAYDTKDYGTIRRIIDAHAAQVALMLNGTATSEDVPDEWFSYEKSSMVLSILLDGEDATFGVIAMEDDEYMLDHLTGSETLKRKYDGAILTENDTDASNVALWTEVHNNQ